MMKQNYKISFCIVCMNRLHHLKQTLVQNLIDNEDYEPIEFVVLDYNSRDGMEEWVKEALHDYIERGIVVYYKTEGPLSWSPSHSKNMAFKLATGDILCNIWADYFTGKGFASYVNEIFQEDSNIVLTPIDFHKTKRDYHPPGDVLGKVCVHKRDFIAVGGFDERMNKHGFEDYDFVNRLELNGVKRVLIEDFAFLRYLSHDDSERFSPKPHNLKGLYVHYHTPACSTLLLLFNDKECHKGVLIDNFSQHADEYTRAYATHNLHLEYSLKDQRWERGVWEERDNQIYLSCDDRVFRVSPRDHTQNQSMLKAQLDATTFYEITDVDTIMNLLWFNHFYDTRVIMEKNMASKVAQANGQGFGNGLVYKNFLQNHPIAI